MPGIIVVGLQWGDEGKGKMIDLLSASASHVVRSQGGNNAGHTLVVAGVEYKLHLIPSGILYPHTHCYITAGMAIDPEVLIKEIAGLEEQKVELENRLSISFLAHIILPTHRLLDVLSEKAKGENFIGTTGRGIGPCYKDRADRCGFRMQDLIDEEKCIQKLSSHIDAKNEELRALYKHAPLNKEEIIESHLKMGAKLKKYVKDAEKLLARALKNKEKVLFEGAHGSLLDVTFGTYPFVTSSGTIAAGVAYGAGIGPSQIDQVLGVAKAYTTRVGNGPLPTALSTEEKALFLDNVTAREIGSTTGRLRRMGWLDLVLLRRSIELNGVDILAVTKLDVLDHLKEIKVCHAYILRGKETANFPASLEDLEQIEPVYKIFPGWQTSTKEAKKLEDLPHVARKYLEYMETFCDTPLGYISVGPEREKTITNSNVYEYSS